MSDNQLREKGTWAWFAVWLPVAHSHSLCFQAEPPCGPTWSSVSFSAGCQSMWLTTCCQSHLSSAGCHVFSHPIVLEWEFLLLQQGERRWLIQEWPHTENLASTGLEVLVPRKWGPGSERTVRVPQTRNCNNALSHLGFSFRRFYLNIFKFTDSFLGCVQSITKHSSNLLQCFFICNSSFPPFLRISIPLLTFFIIPHFFH